MGSAAVVKERPIVFTGESVPAIQRDLKTMTRRVVIPQPIVGPLPAGKYEASDPFVGADGIWRFMRGVVSREADDVGRCPYGEPGDRLWVRETWALVSRSAYSASDGVHQVLRPDDSHDAAVFRAGWDRSPPGRWRSPRFMPRWASRLLLEVTEVRIERLQDITHGDIEREGIPCPGAPRPNLLDRAAHCELFWKRWDALNGHHSRARGADFHRWEANPWVWVIGFKRAA